MRQNVPLGFPLLPLPNSGGALAYPPDLDSSVRESIRIILSTRPGELLLHPDFGVGLDTFLNDTDSLALRRTLHDRIRENLARWEPRIHVDRVQINDLPGRPLRLRIDIAYRLQRDGAPGRVGLTLSAGA